MSDRTVCPIFEKDGNEFIVLHESFVASDSWDAMKIGWGASLVEAVLWRASFTKRTIDVTDGIIHQEAKLQGTDVAIIKGPLLDVAIAESESQ